MANTRRVVGRHALIFRSSLWPTPAQASGGACSDLYVMAKTRTGHVCAALSNQYEASATALGDDAAVRTIDFFTAVATPVKDALSQQYMESTVARLENSLFMYICAIFQGRIVKGDIESDGPRLQLFGNCGL